MKDAHLSKIYEVENNIIKAYDHFKAYESLAENRERKYR
jgi:hypothetical protein